MRLLPAVTLVIPIHSERRWHSFLKALASARCQVPPPHSIIVSVDHNPPLLTRISEQFPEIRTVANSFERGAAGTRNSGALLADTPILVFMDSDIRAREGWLGQLLEPFANPAVVGSGGGVIPHWPAKRPGWFPDEFGWVVGVSYRGQPIVTSPIRNVWSANMAVRRDAFTKVAGFRVDFSKVDNSPKSEDTDFCLRVTEGTGGGIWMFVPEAVVEHEIGPERCRFSFFVRRCFSEGKGKVELAYLNAGKRDLQDESRYVRHLAPVALGRYWWRALRYLDADAARRGVAVIVALGAAGLGAAVGEVQHASVWSARRWKHEP